MYEPHLESHTFPSSTIRSYKCYPIVKHTGVCTWMNKTLLKNHVGQVRCSSTTTNNHMSPCYYLLLRLTPSVSLVKLYKLFATSCSWVECPSFPPIRGDLLILGPRSSDPRNPRELSNTQSSGVVGEDHGGQGDAQKPRIGPDLGVWGRFWGPKEARSGWFHGACWVLELGGGEIDLELEGASIRRSTPVESIDRH